MNGNLRKSLVGWLYVVAVMHWGAGVIMVWFADAPFFAVYHQSIVAGFGFQQELPQASALQVWWFSLLGATLQAFSLLMLALVHIGSRHGLSAIWGWLILGILVWAPQDIWVSLQQQTWLHVWVDGSALLVMLPPLSVLWWIDHSRQRV